MCHTFVSFLLLSKDSSLVFVTDSVMTRRCIAAYALGILFESTLDISYWMIVSFYEVLSWLEGYHCILLLVRHSYQFTLLLTMCFSTQSTLLWRCPTSSLFVSVLGALLLCLLSLTSWWKRLLVIVTPFISSIAGQQGNNIVMIGQFFPSWSWNLLLFCPLQ